MFEIGVIPAAGAGLRLLPHTEATPKVLLEIGGKSLLQHNIELMRDQLHVREIIILIGHHGDQIKKKMGDGTNLGIRLSYIECPHVKKGLATGLLHVRDRINGHFPVILGDELYLDSNHEELLQNPLSDAICGVQVTGNTESIRKNYGLHIQDSRITSLREKPETVENNYLGCGTYIFSPEIFDYIAKTPLSRKSGRVELTDAVQKMGDEQRSVLPFFLQGDYCNINTTDDFNSANYLHRRAYLSSHKVSVVIPAHEESASIATVVKDFRSLHEVNEIIVADNCSTDGTGELAKQAGARVVSGPYRGYGHALRAGMKAASGDLFVLVEADGSFSARDLPKILAYLADSDMVVGTRTTKQLIEQGANMGWLLRWGNVLAAKVLEALFWYPHEPRFTDLGCTYRGIWRDAYESILAILTADGPEFAPEMMVETMRANRKIIEIPVTYRPRIGGVSKHSQSIAHVVRTGIGMMRLILRKRFSLNTRENT